MQWTIYEGNFAMRLFFIWDGSTASSNANILVFVNAELRKEAFWEKRGGGNHLQLKSVLIKVASKTSGYCLMCLM